MTANRWWVRTAARWLARIDGVSGQLRLAMLAMTGLSTASLSLQQYGFGHLAGPLIVATGAGMLVYTYLYTEGGVWNQMRRDKSDLSRNYATPTQLISSELTGRAILAALHERELTDAEKQALRKELDETWAEHRDGIDISAVADGGRVADEEVSE